MAFNNIVTETISYDTAADFSYTDTDIEISSSVAQLVATGGVYPTTDPAISLASTVGMESFTAFSATTSASGSDSVTFHLEVDGTKKYWDGGAWSTSDGTVAQSNTASDINTNASSLSLTGGKAINIFAVLESNDGTTTPTVTSFTWTYDFFGIKPTALTECVVYVWLEDILGGDVSITSATLYARNPKSFKHGNFLIAPFTKSVSFQTLGSGTYAEIQLIETTTPGEKIVFSIEYNQSDAGTALKQIFFDPAQIPSAGNKNLLSITTPKEHDFG